MPTKLKGRGLKQRFVEVSKKYTIEVAHDLMTLMEQKDPDMLIHLEYMHFLMLEADGIYEREAALCDTSKQNVDHKMWRTNMQIL
jgi:nicotinic acid phosphoribosyltransferase